MPADIFAAAGYRPLDPEQLRRWSLPSKDLQLLIRWGLFNWLFGNGDAHAKNISLVFDPAQGIRMTPFYDPVCPFSGCILGGWCPNFSR